MMGYGNGGSWIWMALGVIVLLVLIGVVVWVLIAVNKRTTAMLRTLQRARILVVGPGRGRFRTSGTPAERSPPTNTPGDCTRWDSDHVVAESARSGVNPLPGEPVGARGSSSVPRRPSTSP